MTPAELREAAAVMVAAAEGKATQWRRSGRDEKWNDVTPDCAWGMVVYEYRIKPTPQFVKVRLYRVDNAAGSIVTRICDGADFQMPSHWHPCSDEISVEVKP